MRWIVVPVALFLAACGASSGADQRALPGAPTATSQAAGLRHVVYSHCGVVSTTVDGVLWLADPPLGDDSHNPPPGWDDNDTPGMFVRTSSTDARFTADTGVEAHFVKAKPGQSDPAANCE